ncbi:hypothetical protein GCM10010247_42500 [Streptomyces calvus]|nr:hypothetical protein GCM10010247_42500 [Streptomyces calvus]
MWCLALSADAFEDVCAPAVVRPPSAAAGTAMPAASATAAAVATVAAHALFTCLRKVPPSEVAGRRSITRPGVVSYACAHPPDHAVCRGVIKCLKGIWTVRAKGAEVDGLL